VLIKIWGKNIKDNSCLILEWQAGLISASIKIFLKPNKDFIQITISQYIQNIFSQYFAFSKLYLRISKINK